MQSSKSIDVLGLGCVAVDDFLYVAAYPPADGKAQVRHRDRQCGGLAATALAAAARLGARCAYAGVLGHDELSDFAAAALAKAGVDLTHLAREPDARPIHSTIVVEESRGTRAIYFDLEGAVGASPSAPSEETIRSAAVLLVDPLGVPGMIRASRIARAAGIPVVADFENQESDRFPELLDLADHLILSADFSRLLTGMSDPAKAARALWTPRRALSAVTCGAQGCWYVADSTDAAALHQPAFAVIAVDTTGCGDVFHGAYAAALARGAPLAERLRFASAAAALKATRRGGQTGLPDRATVEQFLEDHPP